MTTEIKAESEEIINILESYDLNGFEKIGGTDKGTLHSYTGAYEFLLSPYRDREVRLLEVGVQYGGSSLLWHDYLPKSRLSLVDVANQVGPNIFSRMDESRYRLYIADAYADSTVKEVAEDAKGFDVMIDDGPHSLQSQILFINKYLPYLNEGGILIIEDIQDFSDCEILRISTPAEYRDNIEIIDLRHIKGRYDDVLFVIRK